MGSIRGWVLADVNRTIVTEAVQAALDELQAAFPPRPLDVQSAFAEWGVSYTDGTAFKAGAQGKRWDELAPEFLEFHHDAPLFLGWPAIGDVLPAYLAAALRRERETGMLPDFLLSALTRGIDSNTARFDAQFGPLAPAQRQAIRRALEAWAASLDRSDLRRPIIEALESYWAKQEG